jgi:hypothetical protein
MGVVTISRPPQKMAKRLLHPFFAARVNRRRAGAIQQPGQVVEDSCTQEIQGFNNFNCYLFYSFQRFPHAPRGYCFLQNSHSRTILSNSYPVQSNRSKSALKPPGKSSAC